MEDCNIYIGILEPSPIIFEGLSNILLKEDIHLSVIKFDSLSELNTYKNKYQLKVIIINPGLIIAGKKEFNALKNSMRDTAWIGVIYNLFEQQVLDLLDHNIFITDNKKKILNTINKILEDECDCLDNSETGETLSEREKDVLIELINGLSNKEIADKLNISIHTVISHRKNITQKTSIKSLAGLTIYAITNNIVSIDEISSE